MCAEHLEVGRARDHRLDALGLRCAREVCRDRPDSHDVVEDVGAIAVVEELRRGEPGVFDA